MTRQSEDPLPDADRSVEDLLGLASPRPEPAAEEREKVREAIHSEWRQVTGRRRNTRRFVAFAAAATVLLAVTMMVNILDTPVVAPVQVASIEKSRGSIFVLGERAEPRETNDLSPVLAGQTIETGKGAAAGLNWTIGGSLRVGENTRVTFLSNDTIELVAGRIYFDSQPSALSRNGNRDLTSKLEIRTEHGVVSHIGTQYMTTVDDDSLAVSVRDGRVTIDGTFHNAIAHEGQKLTFQGSSRPTVVNVTTYGGDWRWIEGVTPTAHVDGKTILEFLLWVSQETGLTFHFETQAVEQLARSETLTGIVDSEPREELRQRMLTADLDFTIDDNGVINIRGTGQRHD